jgi:hypothetical protein
MFCFDSLRLYKMVMFVERLSYTMGSEAILGVVEDIRGFRRLCTYGGED